MIELFYLIELRGEGDVLEINFSVISKLSVQLTCVNFCILCTCMSS